MKKLALSTIIVSMILFPMISSAIAAQPDVGALTKEKASLEDAMDALETEFNLNEAKVPRLKQRKSDLEWSAQAVKKEINKWNAADARLKVKVDNYKSDVTVHDQRCGRTFTLPNEQSAYDACLSSKAALDSRKGKLQNDIRYHNEQRTTVQGLIDNQKVQEQSLQREIDAYLAHRKELVEAGNKIQARLDAIQPYVNACEEAKAAYDRSANPMKDGTMERMKDECGSMFD